MTQQCQVRRQPFPVAAIVDDDLVVRVGQATRVLLPRIGLSNRLNFSSTARLLVMTKLYAPLPVEDKVVEVRELLRSEPVQPQVVEDEKVRCKKVPDGAIHGVVHSALSHGLEEVVGVDETHGVSGAGGGVAQCLGQEALACAVRSYQEDVFVRHLQHFPIQPTVKPGTKRPILLMQ